MSHAEYVAGCDEDQLRSLIVHANARLKVLQESGWVRLWTVSVGWANVAWFTEADHPQAVSIACAAVQKEVSKHPGKEVEMEVRLVCYRPEEAARLLMQKGPAP
jgi:hypothetical protein